MTINKNPLDEAMLQLIAEIDGSTDLNELKGALTEVALETKKQLQLLHGVSNEHEKHIKEMQTTIMQLRNTA